MRKLYALLLCLCLLVGICLLSGCAGDGSTPGGNGGGSNNGGGDSGGTDTTTAPAYQTTVTVPQNDGGYKEEVYNSQQLLIEEYTYDADGKLQGFISYAYNENGLLIRERFFDGDRFGINSFEYEYDDTGKCIKKSEFNTNYMIQNIWEYRTDGTTFHIDYNPWGNRIETVLGTDGKPILADEYQGEEKVYHWDYNADGSYKRLKYRDGAWVEWEEFFTKDDKRISGTLYREDKSVSGTVVGSFDSNGGYLGETITYYSLLDASNYTIEEYGPTGSIIRFSNYENSVRIYYETFEYDAQGRQIRRNCYEGNGTFFEGYGTEYHPDGWLQYVTHYDYTGKKDSVEEYDKDGNFVSYTFF